MGRRRTLKEGRTSRDEIARSSAFTVPGESAALALECLRACGENGRLASLPARARMWHRPWHHLPLAKGPWSCVWLVMCCVRWPVLGPECARMFGGRSAPHPSDPSSPELSRATWAMRLVGWDPVLAKPSPEETSNTFENPPFAGPHIQDIVFLLGQSGTRRGTFRPCVSFTSARQGF